MSRIGRAPVVVPAGVDVNIGADNNITVKGPLGTLSFQFSKVLSFKKEGDAIIVERPDDEKESRSLHGLSRTLLNNMVTGVKDGYKKTLQINGVGYRAAKAGKTLTLNLGHSHPINFEENDGITFDVPDPNTIIVKGADKQKVGQIAAQIREKRPPEPYLGKGVKYDTERIRRKSGKAGK